MTIKNELVKKLGKFICDGKEAIRNLYLKQYIQIHTCLSASLKEGATARGSGITLFHLARLGGGFEIVHLMAISFLPVGVATN